jgi:hypothetical protein
VEKKNQSNNSEATSVDSFSVVCATEVGFCVSLSSCLFDAADLDVVQQNGLGAATTPSYGRHLK